LQETRAGGPSATSCATIVPAEPGSFPLRRSRSWIDTSRARVRNKVSYELRGRTRTICDPVRECPGKEFARTGRRRGNEFCRSWSERQRATEQFVGNHRKRPYIPL